MSRKNIPSEKKELEKLITNYEAAKAENRQLYLDGDQLADISDWYASRSKFEEAQEAVTYGLQLHPGNTDLLVEQAYLYLDTRNLQKAKQVLDSITEAYDPEVKMLKAELLLNEGQLEETRSLLATIEDADELGRICEVVYLYLELGYPDMAKEWMEKGEKTYSEAKEFMALQADYALATQQLDSAIKIYNQLLDIEPYNTPYWTGLAKCYFFQSKWNKAIEACDFALAADESDGEAYTTKAHSFFQLNNFDKSIENYKKAMEYKAVSPDMGYMFIGLCYSAKEDWEKANEYYDKVIDFLEKNNGNESALSIDIYTNKANALAELGRYKEAHQTCKKISKIHPKDATILLTEGKIYLLERKLEKARICFIKLSDIDSSIDMYYMIACAYMENNYEIESQYYLEKVYALDPKFEDVAEKLSVCSLAYGDIESFFKYNNDCAHPVTEEALAGLINYACQNEEQRKIFKKILARMKKEKKEKKESKKNKGK